RIAAPAPDWFTVIEEMPAPALKIPRFWDVPAAAEVKTRSPPVSVMGAADDRRAELLALELSRWRTPASSTDTAEAFAKPPDAPDKVRVPVPVLVSPPVPEATPEKTVDVLSPPTVSVAEPRLALPLPASEPTVW